MCWAHMLAVEEDTTFIRPFKLATWLIALAQMVSYQYLI